MNKSLLIKKLHRDFNFLNNQQISDIVDIIFNYISTSLSQSKRIELRGFGSFSLRKRKVQKSFPKNSNEEISFVEKNTTYFRMGKEFFDRLNKTHAN